MSPEYDAVRLLLPLARDEVTMLAVPLLTGLLPKVMLPFRKVTVPLAVAGVTVACRVTCWPSRLGLGEDDRDVDEVTGPTVRIAGGVEMLVANLLSPL